MSWITMQFAGIRARNQMLMLMVAMPWDAVLAAILMCLYIYLAPFTKVEESFNLQATYDLLHRWWTEISTFDHMTFPGVVPRTFIGAVGLSVFAYPFKMIFSLDALRTLYLIRVILGSLSLSTLLLIRRSIQSKHCLFAARLFTLFLSAQFHVLYYSSRTLPNIFAMLFTNIYFSQVLLHDTPTPFAMFVLGLGCSIFRSELIIVIFSALVLTFLVPFRASFSERAFRTLRLTLYCAFGMTLGASTSVIIDSYFWQTPTLYPELSVFLFNKDPAAGAKWGVSSRHWYFSNALPRAQGLLYIVGVCAAWIIPHVGVPALALPLVMSVLPHKELRFVIYVIPALNAIGAIAIAKSSGLQRSFVLTRLFVLALIASSACITTLSVAASTRNYPSAYALRRLHQLVVNDERLSCTKDVDVHVQNVHIDVYSAGNGISQYVMLQRTGCVKWIYSRKENVTHMELENKFHWLVSERKVVKGFQRVLTEEIFDGFEWRRLRIRTRPRVFVHRHIRDANAKKENVGEKDGAGQEQEEGHGDQRITKVEL